MSSLLQKCKDSLRTTLLRGGAYLNRTTDPAALAGFFNAIRPIDSGHPLIRMGGATDGGYLVPNDLAGIDVCFSPGVFDVADFELDLARRNIKCFLADYSVDAPPVKHELFDFEKKYLGPAEDEIFMTLDRWVQRKAPNDSEMILQMDIEGAEYGVIFDTKEETLRKFRILVIEFHDLDALCDAMGFRMIHLTFMKLLKDFEIVHIHPNNVGKPLRYQQFEIPPLMEFTFLRRDRVLSKRPSVAFPHPLDKANTAAESDFALPKCWYGGA